MKMMKLRLLVLCLFWGLATGIIPAAADAQHGVDQAPQLLVKLRNLDQLLTDIEHLSPPDQGAKVTQQIAMVRGMLQGTEWIDPKRSIVAGMVARDAETNWVALIPFRTANAGFQMAYGAIADDDYYLIAFPPQPGFAVNPAVEEGLRKASTENAASSVVVEAAASELLAMARPRIAAALENRAASPPGPIRQNMMPPAETRAILNDMLQTFEQVETLRLGLDLSGATATLQFDVDALPDTFLAGLLVDWGDDTRLADYQVDMPLTFKSRAYNLPGALQLVGSGFGQFYRQMGIDVNDLAEVTKRLTGEMGGGMKAVPGGFMYEMVYVFQPGTDGEGFIAKTYLPWFENYHRQMAAFLAQQTGQPPALLHERTADSIVAGVKVVGVRTNLNAMLPHGEQDAGVLSGTDQTFEIRLAAVDDLMLIASDDTIMESLITRVRGFETAPAEGPVARFDMDLGAFLEGMQSLGAAVDAPVPLPEDLGNLTTQAEVQNGQLATRTRFNIDDLGKMGAVFSVLTARQAGASTDAPSPVLMASAAVDKRPSEENPRYWYDRGGLQSAYGAYKAAVHSYRKAIARAPHNADAHFQLGVAYGELHRFEAAIMAITRAIELDAEKSAYYYYGRGRVYLLAGEEVQAMRDFMEAGFRGNPDARAYLKDAGVSLE